MYFLLNQTIFWLIDLFTWTLSLIRSFTFISYIMCILNFLYFDALLPVFFLVLVSLTITCNNLIHPIFRFLHAHRFSTLNVFVFIFFLSNSFSYTMITIQCVYSIVIYLFNQTYIYFKCFFSDHFRQHLHLKDVS